MIQRPVVIGLTLCETVIIDADTRNVTLVNCFSHRQVPGVPSGPVPFVVFALLTDGIGEGPLTVRIRRLDTLDVVYRQEQTVRFPDPLAESRFRFRVRSCRFPVTGMYEVQLHADGEMLAHRRLQISLLGGS